jgi:uncharacterized protein (DUF305 family)
MASAPARIAALWLAAAVALSGCAGPSVSGQTGRTSPSSVAATPATIHNAADVTFAQHMIPHHQQAVDMAAMVPSHTANPTMAVIAIHISTDQRAEISTLEGFLNQWGASATGPTMAMDGMVDPATMTELGSLTGPSFDRLWMESMISHHRGALTMAADELAHGKSPDALRMAQIIVNVQQREISYLTDLVSAPE